MSLAKIVVSGKVTKNPEKRFTQNNIPITSFVMDINPQEETIVRVIALGNLAEKIAGEVTMGDNVIVDGRPQVETVQTTTGKDKRIIEINANAVEKLGEVSSSSSSYTASAASSPVAAKTEGIVQFATEELTEELIDEDEIPF